MRIVLLIILVFSALAQAQDKDVLVIHSYHKGYPWTDEFQKGLDQVLVENSIQTRVLYLDTKSHQSREYLDQLQKLYAITFKKESFRAIVVNDNNALALVDSLSNSIGDTPVIFSGINGYRVSLHSNLNATGVVSRIEVQKNVELIRRLQPEVAKIYVVSGNSVTGEGIRDSVDRYLSEFPNNQSLIEHYIPETYPEFEDFLAHTPNNSALLYWSYYSDTMSAKKDQEIRENIAHLSKAPVYVFHDSQFGFGTVGGVIHSGVSQGRSAGGLLMDVLNSSSGALPPVRLATPEVMLDYNAVKKWNLSSVRYDELVNKPEVGLERLKVFISVFVLMAVTILGLLYYLRRLRDSREKARQTQILLESVLEQSHQYIAILDRNGRVFSCNNKLHTLLFEQGVDIEKPIGFFKGWEDAGGERFRQFFQSLVGGESTRFEAEVLCGQSGSILLDIIINPLPEDIAAEPQYLLEANDITLGRLAERKLIEREATMRNYYEQQPVMMLTIDGKGRIQAVNRFAEELLGYRELDMLGRRLRDFYSNESIQPATQLLLSSEHKTKGVWRRETSFRHKNGSLLWIRENIRPLDQSGKLLVVGEDITEIHILTEQLEYQARYDLLTETFNRNHFDIELKGAIEDVANQLRTHAMLYLDLDQLKVLNDTSGHEAGDAAIKFAAMAVESVLPYNAVLSRMGGDEFAVLLKDCTESDAKKIAKAILNELGRNSFQWNDFSLNITCSIGIRLIDDTTDSPQMVHAQADVACHAAKDEGRNRYHFYNQDDQELRRRHLEMESVNLVHEALANDRLELFAQTILHLGEDEAKDKMHFEILVRIKESCGEYISPGIFMPASEKYNVAHLIDKTVVLKTLSWLEHNLDDFDELGLCSINLSGQSMGNKEFVDFLLEAIEHSAVPSHKLCIEITETAAMGNMRLAIELFSKIKARGCLIALDDFGSGLSSFGYLKELPVDIVKIDGLFVRDMDSNETDHIMVRSIHDLAKQMGKRTVAEFVENGVILDRLMELGIDYAQGYVISRPKPLGELVAEYRADQ